MKTWYSTNVNTPSQLAVKLQELEVLGHTIHSVIPVSGQILIISYTV